MDGKDLLLEVLLEGYGLEGFLEICPADVIFAPLIQENDSNEITILAKNLCPFPVEFYSIEFDQTHPDVKTLFLRTTGICLRKYLL